MRILAHVVRDRSIGVEKFEKPRQDSLWPTSIVSTGSLAGLVAVLSQSILFVPISSNARH